MYIRDKPNVLLCEKNWIKNILNQSINKHAELVKPKIHAFHYLQLCTTVAEQYLLKNLTPM